METHVTFLVSLTLVGSRHAFKGTFIWESSANGSALRHTIHTKRGYDTVRHVKKGDDVIRLFQRRLFYFYHVLSYSISLRTLCLSLVVSSLSSNVILQCVAGKRSKVWGSCQDAKCQPAGKEYNKYRLVSDIRLQPALNSSSWLVYSVNHRGYIVPPCCYIDNV